MAVISRIHLRIFLVYSFVFLITIGGIFLIARLFIRGTFERQMWEDAQAFKARIDYTRDVLVQDIHKQVQHQTNDPNVVRAIRHNVPNPLSMDDSVLDVLEYGNADGLITASQGDSSSRRGVIDVEALQRAQSEESQAVTRFRTPQRQMTIEVTLPIGAKGNFLGFVTGGYFLQPWFEKALKNQLRHPIFLREGDGLIALNPSSETIRPAERQSLLALPDNASKDFQRKQLVGVPHDVSRIPLSSSNADTRAELILAYSHRNEIELQEQLMIALLATGGVGLFFVYVVSYVIGLRMTKPINQLAAAATEIASGNLDHRVNVRSRDEIGQAADAFNQMATNLKMNVERRLVAERLAAWRDVARRIAHEIKNPLFPIRLSVENLQRTRRSKPGMFDEIFDECTGTIIEEVGRLQRMVDEFHQFARMPAPKRTREDLNQIVESALNLYVGSAGGVQIETDLQPNLPAVHLDSEQISQAVGNLIKNGFEAMPDGGTLKVSTQWAGKDKVGMAIQDTGIGMSPETQANLFTPYYTTKETGTGLGLAIVQRIITDHDGEIFVESQEGVGTTVRIELPLQRT